MASPSNNRNRGARPTGGRAGGRAGKPNKPVAGTKDKTVRVPKEWNAKTVDPTNNRGSGQRPTGGQAGGRAGRPSGSIARPAAKPPAAAVRAAGGAGRVVGAVKGALGVAGGVAVPAAIVGQSLDVVSGFNRLANHPFLTKNRSDNNGTSSSGGTSKEDNRTNRPGGRGRTTSDATPTRPGTPSGAGSRRGAAPVPGNGRTGRGGTTADAKPTRQGPPVPERLRNAPTPPALPAAVTRTSSGGGGSRSTPRSSAPARSSTPTAPAKPGQKWSDFNPGRGTSKTNNPLMKDMVGRMKDREDKAQASAASKLTNRFNTKDSFSGEKVDGSTVNTKAKINSTTSEYDKKKRRYGS